MIKTILFKTKDICDYFLNRLIDDDIDYENCEFISQTEASKQFKESIEEIYNQNKHKTITNKPYPPIEASNVFREIIDKMRQGEYDKEQIKIDILRLKKIYNDMKAYNNLPYIEDNKTHVLDFIHSLENILAKENSKNKE